MGKDGEKDQTRMSLSELPPINPRPGTGSGKSRQSSGSNSAGNTVTKGYSIKYSERPSLISAEDSGIVINGSESGRFTAGRDPIRSPESPGSGLDDDSGDEEKAASFNGTNNSASVSSRPAMRSRSRTWGSDVQKPPVANKLHTLYEKKSVSNCVRHGSVATASENAKNNDTLKLPSTVGQSSSKSSYSFTFGKRTQSYSNLSSSKFSESSRGHNNNISTVPNRNTSSSNTNLYKVRSDQNIFYKTSAGVNSDYKLTSRTQVAPQSGRKPRMSNAGKHLHSKSQPNIQHALSGNKTTGSNQYRKKFSIGDGGKISQSLVKYNTRDIFGEADEKDKRIIDWLIEIEKEAERPQSPEIEDDEPPQTDTAIHVIYGQD